MHPQLQLLLANIRTEYQNIRFTVYRTAFKLRKFQYELKLDKIRIANALKLLSLPLEGASVGPEFAHPIINAEGVKDIVRKIILQAKSQLGNQTVYPDPDIISSFILLCYDIKKNGAVSFLALKCFFILMSQGDVIPKYRSLFCCYCEPGKNVLTKQNVAYLFSHMILLTKAFYESKPFENVRQALESCFNGALGYGLTEHEFLRWILKEPQSIVWLPTMHRIINAETSRHNVSCRVCKIRSITGLRFHCLRCRDFNLCQVCFLTKSETKSPHKASHPIHEYCSPAKTKDKLRDFGKKLQNVVSKKYKRKMYTKSYLPIDQTSSPGVALNNPGQDRMTETWEEQSLEVTSLSMPEINQGRRSRASNSQAMDDVNLSRISTGFADVSQLAIEGNNQIKDLIKKIEDERKSMIATTQLLVESQNQSVLKSVKDSEEIDMLEAELDEIKHKNSKLERKLKHLTIHSSLPVLTSTPRYSPEHHHSLQQIVGKPNHTQQMITQPKQLYELTTSEHPQFQHNLYSKHSSDSQSNYLTSSGENVMGHGGSADMIYPVPARRRFLRSKPIQTNGYHVVHSPQYEKLKDGSSPLLQRDNSHPSVFRTPNASDIQFGSHPSLYHSPRHVHSQYSSQESFGNSQRVDSQHGEFHSAYKTSPHHKQYSSHESLTNYQHRSSPRSSNSLSRTPRKVESIYGSDNSMYRTPDEPRLVSQTSPTEMNGHLRPKPYSPHGSVDTLHGDVSQLRSPQSSPEHFVTTEAMSPIPLTPPNGFETSSLEFLQHTQMHSSDPNIAEKLQETDGEPCRKSRNNKELRGKQSDDMKLNTEFKIHTPLHSSTMNSIDVAHVHITQQSCSKASHSKNNDTGTQQSSDTSQEKIARASKRQRRKKMKKGNKQDQETDSSLSQDDESNPSEHSNDDKNESFDLAEKELKNLVQKLQDVMPSVHDQENIKLQDTKKPIYSVLRAAEQTRQAMKIFTEYAINIAAGDLVQCL